MFIPTKLTIALSTLAVVVANYSSVVAAADAKLRGATTPSSSRSLYPDPGKDTGYRETGESCNQRDACKRGAACSYYTKKDAIKGYQEDRGRWSQKRCCPTARTTEEWLQKQSSCSSPTADCRDNPIFYAGSEYCGNMNWGECSEDVQCSSGKCENGRCYTPDYDKCELSNGDLYDPNSQSCRPGSACAVIKADVFEEGTCNIQLSNHQYACVPLGEVDSEGYQFPKADQGKPCVTSQFCQGDDSVCCYMDNDSNKGECKSMHECKHVADLANVALHGITIEGFSPRFIRGDGFAIFSPAGTEFNCS